MTVKELKLYCTAMPDIKDTEALQEFMDKERAGTHKVACIKIGIAIGFAIAFSQAQAFALQSICSCLMKSAKRKKHLTKSPLRYIISLMSRNHLQTFTSASNR